jgi:hypothetical protein
MHHWETILLSEIPELLGIYETLISASEDIINHTAPVAIVDTCYLRYMLS